MKPNPTTPRRVSTASQVLITTKYAFLNYFRARRFYVMLGIVLLISALLTFAAAYYRPVFFGFGIPTQGNASLPFYSAFWGSFVSLVILLSAAFFGGDAISGEFQNKTGYFLVPNPIRRSALYAGKWIAALGAASLILAVFALIALADALYFFGAGVPTEFLESVVFAWLYLVSALGLTFMFSSLFKSSAISILMTVILLLFAFNVIDTISTSVVGLEPWFSITYGAGIISNVLRVPYPVGKTVIDAGPRFTLVTFNASIPEGLVILGVYFVLSAILGLLLFERREFT